MKPDKVAKAIEVFEATLITPAPRFDQYLKGNAGVLSATEKQGLKLFMDNGCRGGHGGINGGGSNYYPFGVMEKPGAEILPRGRQGPFRGPKTADDAYVFRAPSLRNVALTAPHSHSGKVWSLSQTVAIMGTRQLGEKLDDGEIAAIPAFLHTLTGEPPRVDYPILPVSTGTTSRPEPMTE